MGGYADTYELGAEQNMSFAGHIVSSPLLLAVSLSQSHSSPDRAQVSIIFIKGLHATVLICVIHLSELPISFVLLCFSGAMVHQQLSHDGDFFWWREVEDVVHRAYLALWQSSICICTKIQYAL